MNTRRELDKGCDDESYLDDINDMKTSLESKRPAGAVMDDKSHLEGSKSMSNDKTEHQYNMTLRPKSKSKRA